MIPFHAVSRIDYTNRTHFFLYDSQMYEKSSANPVEQQKGQQYAVKSKTSFDGIAGIMTSTFGGGGSGGRSGGRNGSSG